MVVDFGPVSSMNFAILIADAALPTQVVNDPRRYPATSNPDGRAPELAGTFFRHSGPPLHAKAAVVDA
jgi:hypothetical protein